MAKYKCSVCGYIYDEEKEGKPLLDSKCPVCGMTMVLRKTTAKLLLLLLWKPLQLRRSWLMIRHTPVVTPVSVIWTISMKWL